LKCEIQFRFKVLMNSRGFEIGNINSLHSGGTKGVGNLYSGTILKPNFNISHNLFSSKSVYKLESNYEQII